MATRGDPHRDRAMMKTPVILVTVALTVAILLAASLVIATGTRGEDAPPTTSSSGKNEQRVFAPDLISFDFKIRKTAPVRSAAF
jgi:hypothetical protein